MGPPWLLHLRIFEFFGMYRVSACALWPSWNSWNSWASTGKFEDVAPWFLNLRIFEFFGMYHVLGVCHAAIFEFFGFPRESRRCGPMVPQSSNCHAAIFELFGFPGEFHQEFEEF